MHAEEILVDDVADFDPVEARMSLEVPGEVGCVEAEKRELRFGECMLDSTTESLDDSAHVEVEQAVEIVFRRALEIRCGLERLNGPALEGACGVLLQPGAGGLVKQQPIPSNQFASYHTTPGVDSRIRAIEPLKT